MFQRCPKPCVPETPCSVSLQRNLRTFIMIRLVIMLCMVASCRAQTCAQCNEVSCQPPENCPGGTVKGPCGCCDVCAKVEGEECGGPFDLIPEGVCDQGLICVKPHGDFNVHGTCKKDGLSPQGKSPDCGENAHFDECGHGACQPTCDNPTPSCTMQCIPSCQCDNGFVLHDGKCIAEDQCPDRKCPEHSHFRPCGTCRRTCKIPNPVCTSECKPPGCYCDPGYFWEEGRCIHRNECHGCSVEGGYYYPSDAHWASETEGTNCMCMIKHVICTPIDRSICQEGSRIELTWKEKYPIWTCISEEIERNETECLENSHFEGCGKGSCQPTCEELFPICHKFCIPSCHCNRGYVLSPREGGCIPISQCDRCLLESGQYYPNGAKWASDEVGVNCMCLKKKVYCAPIDTIPCPIHYSIQTSEIGSNLIWTCVKEVTTICEMHRSMAKFLKPGSMHVFVKQCDDDGLYLPVQCYGFTGDCYCAHPYTGTLYEETRAQGEPGADCSTYWESQGRKSGIKTKCQQERDKAAADLASGIVGLFIKECAEDDTYRTRQCHSSTGYCYCVHPDGTVYWETGERPWEAMTTGYDCDTYWKINTKRAETKKDEL